VQLPELELHLVVPLACCFVHPGVHTPTHCTTKSGDGAVFGRKIKGTRLVGRYFSIMSWNSVSVSDVLDAWDLDATFVHRITAERPGAYVCPHDSLL
jgi:hypothetical protein